MTTAAADVIAGRALWSVERADLLDWLPALPEDSVDLVVCSPPYEQARAYLEDGVDLGVARDTEEWVAWMVRVCRELRRVCKGLCALVVEGQTRQYRYTASPFLLMADLHREGFHLRKPPVYRRVGIPGSGGPDWWRNDWEPVVAFTKGGRLPWSDNTATGAPPKFEPGGRMANRTKNGKRVHERSFKDRGSKRNGMEVQGYTPPDIANPGNVVDCGAAGGGNMGSGHAHDNEAPYPEALVEPFVRCFCPEGGVVLDCFAGSGTTLAVALKWGRRAIGCDLRQSQVDLASRRIRGEALTMFDAAPEANP